MAGCHTLLICAHLCLSVGGFLRQTVLCVLHILWEHSLRLLCWQRGVFSHGYHGFTQMVMLRCWRRGYGRMPYPPNLCASVPICGRHISIGRFRVFCGNISLLARLVHLWAAYLRRFPFAIQSDCVRRPIGLRSPSDRIPFAARCHKWRVNPAEIALQYTVCLRSASFYVRKIKK